MEQWMLSNVEQYGAWAVFLLVLAETVFPPIPSEVILLSAGVFVVKSGMGSGEMIFAATVGSAVGAMFWYMVGKKAGNSVIQKSAENGTLRRLGISSGDLRKGKEVFARYGYPAVFFGRLIPIVRSVISLPAGMGKMPLGPFLLLTAVGSLLWNGILVYLGMGAGEHWRTWLHFFSIYSEIILVIGIVLGIGGIYWWIRNRKK